MKALLKSLAAIFVSAAICAATLELCACGDKVDILKAGESPDYQKTATNDSFEYDAFNDHIAIVSYNGAQSRVEIPSKIEDKPVTQISANAFYNCNEAIKTVVIPKTVTVIEAGAFTGNKIEDFKIDGGSSSYIEKNGAILDSAETSLLAYACGSKNESFTIPDTVEEIPSGVFSVARGLKSLVIPKSVKKIGTFALMNTGLTKAALTGVESLGMGAFWNCLDLVELELPECLMQISSPESVCQNCKSLKIVKGYDSTPAERLIKAEGVKAEYISLG